MEKAPHTNDTTDNTDMDAHRIDGRQLRSSSAPSIPCECGGRDSVLTVDNREAGAMTNQTDFVGHTE